jgi:molecular chaperone DnaK
MASDNKTIGLFSLDGIAPAPRGRPQIEVTFDIDANGILHVSAKDLGTGKVQKITIQASSGLDEKDIQRMVRDAEEHASDDAKRKEDAEVHNQGDAMVFQIEKLLQENGDKIPADAKSNIESKIADLKKAVESKDTERTKTAMADLQKAAQAIGEALYAQPNAGGAQSSDSSTSSNTKKDDGDDIIDAEVVN